jgi:hypothetical protein
MVTVYAVLGEEEKTERLRLRLYFDSCHGGQFLMVLR